MSTRAVRKLMALLTVVSLLTPFASARGAAAACGATSGAWTTIAGPKFPIGSQAITDLALDARTPSRFYVTNGLSVMRTADGGCSWQHSYTLGEQAETFTPANSQIRQVVVPEAGGRVLLSIAETVVNQTRPHVLVSTNAGRSWESGDAGLPPLGSPEKLVVAPSSPDIAYLAVDLSGGALDSLFVSSNGGMTWQSRTPHLGGEFTGFEVDPLVPNELWAYGNGLHKSTDGGENWTPIPEFVGVGTGPVDIFHARGQKSSLFVFIPEQRIVQKSEDGGENWLQVYGLAAPDSVDHGAAATSRVATSGGHAFIWAPSLFQWVDARAPASGVTDVSASRVGPAFYMHTARSIVIFAGDTGTDVDIDRTDFDIGNISLPTGSDPLPGEEPKLAPAKDVVKIPAGETKRVRYDLSLSKVRTPLDLYFLVDTSESAKPFLKGLAHVLGDLVTKLYGARLDVQFGLAEYRAYPDSTPPRPECNDDVPLVVNSQCERNFIYRQRLDISPSSAQLALAIEDLVPIAGGHYNAQLPALQQVATGSGVDDWPYTEGDDSPSHVDGHDVQPGQDATFRDKALKIVLMSTDEEFSEAGGYPDDDFPPRIPSFDQVIADLNDRQIHQVGLALGPAAVTDLRRVAAGTGALAPEEGADCDGNGAADVAPGQPLVCMAERGNLEQGSNLVPAIVNLVEAIRDREPVALDVSSKDPVVDEVTPEEFPGVALQVDQDLKFEVTYRCPTSMAGERAEVDLSASQGGGALARATATVVCGKRPPKDFFSAFSFDRVIGLALLPLAPPPTLANPGQATQAQSQAQAQGAMATQEQEQPQVAFATQHKAALKEALAKEDELQMSRYRDRSEPAIPDFLFGASAVTMAAAYALAVSRRRRTAVAKARR